MSPTEKPPILPNHPSHALGQYRAWEVEGDADDLFDQVWISLAGATRPKAHRVLPHGEPSIAILRQRDRSHLVSSIRLVICRPDSGAHWYRPSPREELIAVRIKPEWAQFAIGYSPADLLQEGSNIIDAPQRIAQRCEQSLRFAESADAPLVAQSLFAELRRAYGQPAQVNVPEMAALQCLRKSRGRIRTGELCDLLGVSERGLRRRFQAHFGCSPKSYARQLRLTSAMLVAEKHEKPLWAQLADSAGFHDQAHMINEFRAMLGMTPQMLLKERRALAGFYNS